ncbi:MAG: hypothetical protein V2A58_02050 [Planctomycetota bacterium]
MSYDKRRLAEHLKSIAGHILHKVPDPASVHSMHLLGGGGVTITMTSRAHGPVVMKTPDDGTPTLAIVDEGCYAREEFLVECLKDEELATLVGSKAISEQLDAMLKARRGAIAPNDDTDQILREELLKPLRDAITDWTVYVPLANLHVKSEISIGNVAFVPRNRGLLQNVALAMRHEFSPSQTPQEQDSGRVSILDIVADAAKCSAWAMVSLRSHPKNLDVVAKAAVDTAVNLLRAFTYTLYRRDQRRIFGLAAEVHQGRAVLLARSTGADLHFPSHRTGYLMPFELGTDELAHLRANCAFDTLCALAAKSPKERNTLESAVLVAAHWVGRSVAASTPEDAFTWLTIAIERLVICDGEKATTDQYADRLTFLLSDIKEQRQSIQRVAKRLYDLRSKIVHSGYLGVTKTELAQLEQLAVDALINSLQLASSLASQDALRNLLNERKLD